MGSMPVVVMQPGGNSEAAVRIGEIVKSDREAYRTINWSDMPPKTDLNVRMSGLVWPEASQRIANSAYSVLAVTRLETTSDCNDEFPRFILIKFTTASRSFG